MTQRTFKRMRHDLRTQIKLAATEEQRARLKADLLRLKNAYAGKGTYALPVPEEPELTHEETLARCTDPEIAEMLKKIWSREESNADAI